MKNILILFCFTMLFGFLSCTKYSDIKSGGQKKMLVVLGEIRQGEPVSIHLFQSNSISDTASFKTPVTEATVTLLNREGSQLSVLTNKGNGEWSTSHIPLDQKELYFSIVTNEKKLQIKTIIPDEFSAGVTKKSTQSNTRDISLQINSPDANRNYIIEFIKADVNGGLHLLEIESSDKSTDNNIYNELVTPAPRIFLRTNAKEKLLDLKLYTPDADASDKYVLRIKSVEPDYYKYLYEYEVQKSRGNLNIPFFAVSNDYLGVVGGCRIKDIIIQ